MSITPAPGYPDYGSGAPTPTGFIPEFYEAKTIERLYEKQLIPQLTTTEYSGTVKDKGDAVKITVAPPITVEDYVAGQDMTLEAPMEIARILRVDEAKSFAIVVDDVHAYQSHLDLMTFFANEGAKSLADALDKDFFAFLAGSDIAAENQGLQAGAKSGLYNLGEPGTPIQITADNALQTILSAAAVLDEQNVPRDNRWIVIPAAWNYFLKKSDFLRRADATGDDKSVVRTPTKSVGEIDGFQVYVSNNLHVNGTTGEFTIPFGDQYAVGYVSQIVKTSMLEMERRFAHIIKGLSVYGWSVLDNKRHGKVIASFK